MAARTLFEKVWSAHEVVPQSADTPAVLFIDLHLTHEVTSPQAFALLRERGLKVRRPDLTLATMDHATPTRTEQVFGGAPITIDSAAKQIRQLERNCADFGIELLGLQDARRGIVHIIGPELGVTQPGKTIVCGDSHTSTHGAFGALAFGIGTTEVGHVLATQCLLQKKPRTCAVEVRGRLPAGVTAKDLILALIGRIGVSGGTGHVLEYRGEAIRAFSMEERMTVCNMSIEGGARAALDGHVADRHALFHGERADRLAAVLEHMAGAARDADPADQREDQVLGGDAGGQAPADLHRAGARLLLQQALRRQHVAHLGGADAEGEGAEGAVGRGVAVAADDGLAGLGDAELRADDVHDAATRILQAEQLDAEVRAVALELADLLRGGVDGDGRAAEHLLGAGRRGMVHGREGEVGAAHLEAALAQQREGLRRGDLVRQVQVDEQHRRGVGGLRHDLMRGPDLLEQRAGGHLRPPPWRAATARCG